MAPPTGRPIRRELLDSAETWIRRTGVNGFSYGDLAGELGIAAPSVHHHFRTKDDLVAEVAERYRTRFAARVGELMGTSADRLEAYAGVFSSAADDDLMCLCGAMASEWLTVGERSQRAVTGFFADQRSWLQACLADGVADGSIRSDIDLEATANSILAALEGTMLMVRAGADAGLPVTTMANLTGVLATT